MTTHMAMLELRVDAKGMVEISGLTHGEDEAKRLARDLGLGAYEPLNIMSTIIRSGPYDVAALAAIKNKAAEKSMRLVEVASLEELHPKQPPVVTAKGIALPPASTMAVLHEHTLGPTTKQKLYLPFLFLGVLAVVVGIGAVVRDHMSKSYDRKASLGDVLALAGRPTSGGNALAGLINPDDSRYASVEVTSWPFWLGKSAVVETYYVRIPGLRERSIEEMVKGDKGAQPVVLKFDTGRRDGATYRVDALDRGNLPTPNNDLDVTIIPLVLAAEPAISEEGGEGAYKDASGVRSDQEKDIRALGRFSVQAFVIRRGTGFVLRAENFSVAVSGSVSPGFAAILNDLAVSEEAVNAARDGKLGAEQRIELNRRKATWFLEMGDLAGPGGGAAGDEIGAVRIDGVGLRKIYVRNVEA
jgi:hypothetical protein